MYQLIENGIKRLTDDAVIPCDDRNRDYQEFLQWKTAGNQPRPCCPSEFHKWDEANSKWIVNAAKKGELLQKAFDKLDAATNQMILHAFKYKNQTLKLSAENQRNYANEFQLRDRLSYPHFVKTAGGFIEISSADEYKAFYAAFVAHIRGSVEKGWKAKKELKTMNSVQIVEYLNNNKNKGDK